MEQEHFLSSEEDRIYNSPEKWYVRDKWAYYATERKRKSGKDFINLLTLTSAKCYDVIFFKERGLLLTTDTGYAPESLTFCECIPQRYVMIRNVLPGARDWGDKIEAFVEAGNSHISNRAQRWFPYDVINLDFTKPGFRQRGEKTSITVQTISKIFTIQRLKNQSFTLFLTLPAVEEGDDEAGKSELEKCLRSNLQQGYTDFKNRFLEKYSDGELPDYRHFLLVVVPKLIIKYGQSENFDTLCLYRCTYTNEGAQTVMTSFMFDCEFVGLQDGYESQNPAEILAAKYPQRISEILEQEHENINSMFAKDPELREKYLQYVKVYD